MRHILHKIMPSPERLLKRFRLGFLRAWLTHPGLWRLHRQNVSAAVAVGFFCAFVPFPVQTVCAALIALCLRVNLPVAALCTLVSNPLTFPFLYYYAYVLGSSLLGNPVVGWEPVLSFSDLMGWLTAAWRPLLVGCVLLGTLGALLGFLSVSCLWRGMILARRRKHKRLRRQTRRD